MPLSLTTDRSSKPVEDFEGSPRRVRFTCSTESEPEAVGARAFRKGQRTAKKPPNSSPRKTGCVYFIAAPELRRVKIGYARDLPRRLSALQVSSPCPLVLVAAVATDDPAGLERKLHKRFAHLRIQGEWFGLTDELDEEMSRYDVEPKSGHRHRPWLTQDVGGRVVGVCRDCGRFCVEPTREQRIYASLASEVTP
jgi:hypothetical protein